MVEADANLSILLNQFTFHFIKVVSTFTMQNMQNTAKFYDNAQSDVYIILDLSYNNSLVTSNS